MCLGSGLLLGSNCTITHLFASVGCSPEANVDCQFSLGYNQQELLVIMLHWQSHLDVLKNYSLVIVMIDNIWDSFWPMTSHEADRVLFAIPSAFC